MTPVPVRLQRCRAKGARLVSPNGLPVVCVTRGTKWGNPFAFGYLDKPLSMALYRQAVGGGWNPAVVSALTDEQCHEVYRVHNAFVQRFIKAQGCLPFLAAYFELRGKNLACWCPVNGAPCHADSLLELANVPEGSVTRGE